MERRTIFGGWLLPAALVLPQLLLTGFFFLCPAGHRKKNPVRSNCGSTSAAGSSQPPNIVRRSIRRAA